MNTTNIIGGFTQSYLEDLFNILYPSLTAKVKKFTAFRYYDKPATTGVKIPFVSGVAYFGICTTVGATGWRFTAAGQFANLEEQSPQPIFFDTLEAVNNLQDLLCIGVKIEAI